MRKLFATWCSRRRWPSKASYVVIERCNVVHKRPSLFCACDCAGFAFDASDAGEEAHQRMQVDQLHRRASLRGPPDRRQLRQEGGVVRPRPFQHTIQDPQVPHQGEGSVVAESDAEAWPDQTIYLLFGFPWFSSCGGFLPSFFNSFSTSTLLSLFSFLPPENIS